MNAVINIKPWISAFRLRTLPLAISTVGMGGFLAAFRGYFDVQILTWTIITTLFLQILSNLANDYGDYVHGADSDERSGPSRAVQSGHISSRSMVVAIVLFSILSFFSGIYLLYISVGFTSLTFYFFLGLGILSIAAAITYTAGKRPYGYAGLGDLSVFMFFGLAGVLGSYYLYSRNIEMSDLLPSFALGAFSVGVLNVNNIRDIESDKKAGKLSIPVRLGREKAILYHKLLIVFGFLSATIFTVLNYESVFQWAYLLTIPFFFKNIQGVSKETDPRKMDPYLKQMALSTLVFVLTFGAGLLIS